MKGTKKLGENEDWEACDSTLQIGHLFGRNGFSEIFSVRAPNWRSADKQEKQAKKDYYDVSGSLKVQVPKGLALGLRTRAPGPGCIKLR